jgi:hypothetical protein
MVGANEASYRNRTNVNEVPRLIRSLEGPEEVWRG